MFGMDSSAALTDQANFALSQSMARSSAGLGSPAGTAAAANGNPEATRKAAQSFEAVFLSQMFGQMFQGVGSDSLFGGGPGEDMFRSMLVDEYGKLVAKRGGVGIANAVLHTLISQQEKSR